MKHTRYALLVFTLLIATILLSACSGAAAANSWPGITATEDTVYSAENSHVYSLNSGNGSLNWQFPAVGADAKVAFYAPPLAAGNLVIAGDFGNILYGLDKVSGAQKWAFAEAKGRWVAAPLAAGDLIIAPNADREVYAINQNGQKQWMFATTGQNWAQPATDGQNVFISSLDHFVYALRLSDGKQVWSTDLGGSVVHSQILSDDGILYIGTLGSEMIAVDSKTGKIIWRSKTPGSVWGKAILKDKVLYVGDQTGKVSAFSATNGKTIWTVDAGGPVIGSGTAMGDALIFGTENSILTAVDTKGTKMWNITVSGKLYSDIVLAGDKVVTSALESDKSLQAFADNGKVVWEFTSPK
jgi:outer membrane protein assembly factor BamB